MVGGDIKGECTPQPAPKCPKGQFTNNSNSRQVRAACAACPDGEYQPVDAFDGTVCQDQPTCPKGQKLAAAYDTKSRATCDSCVLGQTYQDQDNFAGTACKDQPDGKTIPGAEGPRARPPLLRFGFPAPCFPCARRAPCTLAVHQTHWQWACCSSARRSCLGAELTSPIPHTCGMMIREFLALAASCGERLGGGVSVSRCLAHLSLVRGARAGVNWKWSTVKSKGWACGEEATCKAKGGCKYFDEKGDQWNEAACRKACAENANCHAYEHDEHQCDFFSELCGKFGRDKHRCMLYKSAVPRKGDPERNCCRKILIPTTKLPATTTTVTTIKTTVTTTTQRQCGPGQKWLKDTNTCVKCDDDTCVPGPPPARPPTRPPNPMATVRRFAHQRRLCARAQRLACTYTMGCVFDGALHRVVSTTQRRARRRLALPMRHGR